MRGAATLHETTRAPRFVALLREPFGALLLEQVSRVEYTRVAAGSLFAVQVRGASLIDLIDIVRTIEVL
jgi:hypothetical protein